MIKVKKKFSQRDFSKTNNVFIDCGSNIGQGFDFFSTIFKVNDFDYILIEPNPFCVSILKEKYKNLIFSKKLTIINKAVSNRNGNASLFGLVERGINYQSQGASIMKYHNSKEYSVAEDSSIQVEIFDFSEYLSECSNIYDSIFIKMDIEGSEYEVLESLLVTGISKSISHLFVEFHSDYMLPKMRLEFKKLEKQLLKTLKGQGCKVSLWY